MSGDWSRREFLIGCASLSAFGALPACTTSAETDTAALAHFDCLTPQTVAFAPAPIVGSLSDPTAEIFLPHHSTVPADGLVRVRATIRPSDAWRRSDSLDPSRPGVILGVHFMNGTSAQRSAVRRYAPEWSRVGPSNVTFRFDVPARNARIRIRFDRRLNDSEIGRDALDVPVGTETMNLWNVSGSDALSRRVVLHEFGHALGLQHEHQHPDGGIPWDRPAVYRYYRDNYGWSTARVDRNIFQTYDRTYRCAGFPNQDFRSVMMYDIRPELTGGRFSVTAAGSISRADAGCLRNVYRNV